MPLWIPITIAAAFFQNLRFMLQKSLSGDLGTLGVTFARFVYAAPLAWAVVGALWLGGMAMPGLTAGFFVFAGIGGLAQILATLLLVALFSLRNFAVGVTFSKTETVMTAILSGLILSEPVGAGAWTAILVTVAGLILMAGVPAPGRLLGGLFSRASAMGIASGVIFAMASIGYRGGSLALEGGHFAMRAAFTLAVVTSFQTLVMGVWLAWRRPGRIGAVLGAWRGAGLVGLTGMLGSLGWFMAFTLQNAAYVKVLGQVELVFTVLASVFFFRERLRPSEACGIVLIVSGIVLLVLGPGWA